VRRVVTLLLLYGGMQFLLPIGAPGHGGSALLTFGFLILAAYTCGEIAAALRGPRVLGYLAAGMLFGPSALGVVTTTAVDQLGAVSSLAVALIAFLAGAELRWRELRAQARTTLAILAGALTVSFVGILGVLLLLRERVPFLQGQPAPTVLAFAVLFTSIAIVHSPAVTMAILSETRATGPVARTTLGVVLLADLVVIVLFSGAIALAQSLVPPTSGDVPAISLGRVVWEICGAVLVGALLGGAIALYLRFIRRELFLFALLIAFLGGEIAALAHTEALLTLLTAGFVAENVSPSVHADALRHAMERSAAPVFVVFFALAGAQLALGDLATVWPLVLPLVAVRALGIWGGSALGARLARVRDDAARRVWMGLVSQAGVAIGLAAVAAQVYPNRGAQLRTLFLAVLAINQTVGPVLFRVALDRAGEIPRAA